MKRILVVFGTRPEAIKMAPVVKALAARPEPVETILCVTGQHREMLDQVLNLFQLRPDHHLTVMEPGQSLASLTSKVLLGFDLVLEQEKPDIVVVHGDTTTTLAAGLAAFYRRIPVAHVEAGLRTGDPHRPWPEEVNRRATATFATYHFAPTESAAANLRAEGVPDHHVWVTGNTVIDALDLAQEQLKASSTARRDFEERFAFLDATKRLILVTGHRRESFGSGIEGLCRALQALVDIRADIEIIYPVHLNENVKGPVTELLGQTEGIHLIPPLDYGPFVQLMERAHLIISDSGGIQEEAPHLGKPVLVTRQVTERPEAIAAGVAKLVGTDVSSIVEETLRLLDDQDRYTTMSQASNPYGDGQAARRIAEVLADTTNEPPESSVAETDAPTRPRARQSCSTTRPS